MPKVVSDIAQKSARPPAAPLYVFKRFLRLFFGKMPYSNRKIEIFGSPAGLARDAAVIQKPPSPGKKILKKQILEKKVGPKEALLGEARCATTKNLNKKKSRKKVVHSWGKHGAQKKNL